MLNVLDYLILNLAIFLPELGSSPQRFKKQSDVIPPLPTTVNSDPVVDRHPRQDVPSQQNDEATRDSSGDVTDRSEAAP